MVVLTSIHLQLKKFHQAGTAELSHDPGRMEFQDGRSYGHGGNKSIHNMEPKSKKIYQLSNISHLGAKEKTSSTQKCLTSQWWDMWFFVPWRGPCLSKLQISSCCLTFLANDGKFFKCLARSNHMFSRHCGGFSIRSSCLDHQMLIDCRQMSWSCHSIPNHT